MRESIGVHHLKMDANGPISRGLRHRLKNGNRVIRVKNILGDDVYGLWHVK